MPTDAGWSIGDIKMTGSPTGGTAGGALQLYWLLCDGSAVSRATYANLFAEIGTTFGDGDGTTTFNLPDFRGRSPMGSGTGSNLTTRFVGDTPGAESNPILVSSVPPLTVDVTEPNSGAGHGHAAPSSASFVTAGTGSAVAAGSGGAGGSGNTASATTGIEANTLASTTQQENVHPISVVAFIIYYGNQ